MKRIILLAVLICAALWLEPSRRPIMSDAIEATAQIAAPARARNIGVGTAYTATSYCAVAPVVSATTAATTQVYSCWNAPGVSQ